MLIINHIPRKILFLRVGIDTGSGGTLGPIFSNRTFEYVPIPENPAKLSARSVYYNKLPARSGGMLDQFVPVRYQKGAAHYDPEFLTYTYGDPTLNKRRQLLHLAKGDYLVFYAGLRSHDLSGNKLLYVIGYFAVKNVHNIPYSSIWPHPNYPFLYNNAHFRRNAYDPGLVVVEGFQEESRLLQKAELISDEAQTVLPEITSIVGFDGSIKRAIGRWVIANRIDGTIKWLHGLP